MRKFMVLLITVLAFALTGENLWAGAEQEDLRLLLVQQVDQLVAKANTIVQKAEATKGDLDQFSTDVNNAMTILTQKKKELDQDISGRDKKYNEFRDKSMDPAIVEKVRNQYRTTADSMNEKLKPLYLLRGRYGHAINVLGDYFLDSVQKSIPQIREVLQEVEENSMLKMSVSDVLKDMLKVTAQQLEDLAKNVREE